MHDKLKAIRDAMLPVILLVSHQRGGGTGKYTKDLPSFLSNQAIFLQLTKYTGHCFQLSILNIAQMDNFFFYLPKQYTLLKQLLAYLRLDRIHLQHLLDVPADVFRLIEELQLPYDFTVHDYYLYCPQIHLNDENNRYCGEPDIAGCEACLAKRPITGIENVNHWRTKNEILLKNAARVFAPTQSVANRIRKHFPHAHVVVAWHPDTEMRSLDVTPVPAALCDNSPLRIVLLGALSDMKGEQVIKQTAVYAKKNNLPLAFHLLGASTVRFPIITHGQYTEENLFSTLKSIEPHLVWFPAQVPETYSYTLSETMMAGLPVVVTDLGALPERVQGRAWSWIQSWQLSPADWANFFVGIREKNFLKGKPPEIVGYTNEKPTFSYRNHYIDFKRSSCTESAQLALKLKTTAPLVLSIKNLFVKQVMAIYQHPRVRAVFKKLLSENQRRRLKEFFRRSIA